MWDNILEIFVDILVEEDDSQVRLRFPSLVCRFVPLLEGIVCRLNPIRWEGQFGSSAVDEVKGVVVSEYDFSLVSPFAIIFFSRFLGQRGDKTGKNSLSDIVFRKWSNKWITQARRLFLLEFCSLGSGSRWL